MEERVSKGITPDAVENLMEAFPQILDKLVPEFEILTGKRFKATVIHPDLKSLERKLRRLLNAVSQLQQESGEPLTPESAKTALELLNRLIRVAVSRIPRNKEPMEYLIQEVEKQSDIPPTLVPPAGLDYEAKHNGLQEFVHELVSSVDESTLDAFLQGSFTEHQLVSQFQRVFSKISLPKELQRLPPRITARTAERIKLGLRDVTADWDALMNLLYGLVLLKQGGQTTWGSVRRVALWNKVGSVRQDPRLVTLAKQEWVTVRNSLDHGWAFFDPAKGGIEFPDRTRRVSWGVEPAFPEGIDIFLANTAMLRTWIFVQKAKMQSFKEQLAQLRSLAQQ